MLLLDATKPGDPEEKELVRGVTVERDESNNILLAPIIRHLHKVGFNV